MVCAEAAATSAQVDRIDRMVETEDSGEEQKRPRRCRSVIWRRTRHLSDNTADRVFIWLMRIDGESSEHPSAEHSGGHELNWKRNETSWAARRMMELILEAEQGQQTRSSSRRWRGRMFIWLKKINLARL